MYNYFRESNERLASLEKEKAKTPIFVTPPQDSTPKASQQTLTPKELKFSTPVSKKGTSVESTPTQDLNSPGSVVDMSDIDSLSVSSTGTTPEFSKMSLGRGRGRPRKVPKAPETDDYPYDGTEEEKDRYIAKKKTELWRFKKLTSTESAAYRAKENQRVKEYNMKKKLQKDSSESETERKKKLSRER